MFAVRTYLKCLFFDRHGALSRNALRENGELANGLGGRLPVFHGTPCAIFVSARGAAWAGEAALNMREQGTLKGK